MNHRSSLHAGVWIALAAAITTTTLGCDSLLEVRNPDVIDAATVDPAEEPELFSRSAFQSFASAHGLVTLYMAWYTGEMWVGDTFPTRNEYGRRAVVDTNNTHRDVFGDLSRGIAQSEQFLNVAGETGGAGSDVNIARVALASGYSILSMADAFCEGTFSDGNEPGPRLTTVEMLDAAAERLTRAISVGEAAGTGDGASMANAARVGIARAHLQAGRDADAALAAAAVPEGFVFEIPYVDQQGARSRLGNRIFQFSAGGSRESAVVPPAYREIGVDMTTEETQAEGGDPRIPFFDSGRDGQDNTLRLWSQLKYPGWSSPMRLASHLEARYIEAEANLNQNIPADALLLINERREVGGQGAFVGTGDAVMAELMEQKARDLWLEGTRMGDWRRNPDAVPNVTEPGDYYKDGLGPVNDQTCWPMPIRETDENPNFN